jgi:CBS-domain-containing membrane protein
MTKRELIGAALVQWRSENRVSAARVTWFVLLLGGMAGLGYISGDRFFHEVIWLVPPFAATLSILMLLPASSIAQPIPVIAGSTLGATTGTVIAMAVHGTIFAVLAAVCALLILSILRVYHPPGVALSMYPLLLHPGVLFPLAVVLPFTLLAVTSAAFMSRRISSWPAYPRPLRTTEKHDSAQGRTGT